MTIPSFTIDGILPPYIGATGPGDHRNLMTPYEATALDLAMSFGTTTHRQSILRGWLNHRGQLRALGFQAGFQWIDGSFVEDKVPNDVDVVSFLKRPRGVMAGALDRLMRANLDVFDRRRTKANYSVDAFFVDLDGTKDGLVDLTRYYLGLFSHRRSDGLWKGMVKVPLDAGHDADASQWLDQNRIIEEQER